jgi:hypothetical protein
VEEYKAYCVKCRVQREMKNPERVAMKNGRPAVKGHCDVCKTGLYRILRKNRDEGALQEKGEE